MRDYNSDLRTCKELEGRHGSFGAWALDVLPWYIRRCMALETGLKDVRDTAASFLQKDRD